jgi:hypothetical protein
MIPADVVEKIDQSNFMKFLLQQGLVGILLIILIGLNAFQIIWVSPENTRRIAAESRAEVREALQDANLAHARAEEANAKAFLSVLDRLDRRLGDELRIPGNPFVGAAP